LYAPNKTSFACFQRFSEPFANISIKLKYKQSKSKRKKQFKLSTRLPLFHKTLFCLTSGLSRKKQSFFIGEPLLAKLAAGLLC